MNKTLVVMIKEPRPGRVKTRLGRDIGLVSSAWWFRHHSADLLRRLRDPRWRIILATAPDTAVSSRVWPADLDRITQGTGDLGQRMTRMLKSAAKTGPVCLIGADIPGIQRAHIARAFGALGDHDAVFGPAPDGGFWLVGARHPKRLPRGAFAGARWSSIYALSDSLDTLHGQRIALVDTLADVDTVEDLRAVQG
ncbi:TIGR04282 family arsenosugar biosynthesis glycosyltransferase [Epibacterium ulvae]|uniref:TIGR04282 family arsenosugar biosynthesis glycosyltransferase n=1 Tax=Epibacterium ulvae TaxID=1156985 RepID=UPI001BFC04D4|nr:TIGR04282 family arsenosugar biosynthesis glycosyltransferase [Epibacterium ulvae]MBT8153217.1 TIGR04282 family arsenosugar biosynthesis glycosyltransferase [Epibacterium ulvae]